MTIQIVTRKQLPLYQARHIRWATDFLALAQWWADRKSKDPSTKVGAVITRRDNTIVSMGYNGFPRGVIDDHARLVDRDTKYALIVHAEMNAILTARQYLKDCTLHVTIPPCNECAKAIIQSGIQSVITWKPEEGSALAQRWAKSSEITESMFNESNVNMTYLFPGIQHLLHECAS